MTWVRLADEFTVHRKVRPLSDAAFRLHVSGLCWSSQNLTDGLIPADELRIVSDVKRPTAAVSELVLRDLWHTTGHSCDGCPQPQSGWVIHDYTDLNPSAVEVKEKRRIETEKKRRLRRKSASDEMVSLGLSPGDTQGDNTGDGPRDNAGDTPRDSPARARGLAHPRVPVPSRPDVVVTASPSVTESDARETGRQGLVSAQLASLAAQYVARHPNAPTTWRLSSDQQETFDAAINRRGIGNVLEALDRHIEAHGGKAPDLASAFLPTVKQASRESDADRRYANQSCTEHGRELPCGPCDRAHATPPPAELIAQTRAAITKASA